MSLAKWMSGVAAGSSLCMAVWTATPVYAQTSRERARDLFVDAGQAASRGEWAAAVDLYLESYVTFPHPSTLHNIGRCYFQHGDDYQALSFTARALYEAPQDGVSRLSDGNRAAASQQLSELLARMGRVVLTPNADLPSPAWIRVDGVPVTVVPLTTGDGLLPIQRSLPEPVSWRALDALWLLPGLHEVQVSDGAYAQTARVHVQRGEASQVTFAPWPQVKEPAPNAPSGSVRPAQVGRASVVLGVLSETNTNANVQPRTGNPLAIPSTNTDVELDNSRAAIQQANMPWRTIALGSWAASAVGLGLGVGATIVANDLDAELRHACPSGDCPPESAPQAERYDRTVIVSYVGFGVGVLAALTGGVFWLLDSETSPSSERIGSKAHRSPSVALGSDGQRLLLRGRF